MSHFDYDHYLSAFRAAAASSGFSEEVLAEINGDPISVWSRKAGNRAAQAPRIYISSGIHGDEPAGPLALLEYLRSGQLSDAVDWALLPLLNPSGLRKSTRENADGIDLNRDFLKASTPEVQAIVNWYRSQPPTALMHFSLHEDWEASGFYMYAINTSPYPCFARELVQSLLTQFRFQAVGPVDGHELTSTGLITHSSTPDEPEGWPEAIWLVKSLPTMSYTFEAPGGFPPAERVEALRLTLEQAVRLFFKHPLPANAS